MKTFTIIVISLFLGIFLSNYLDAVHKERYNVVFASCEAELIKNNNYKSLEQAFRCTEKDPLLKVLGTLLSSEGSIFRDVSQRKAE